MTHPVVFTANCPECHGSAEWTATPITRRETELSGANAPTLVPSYQISCESCDGGSE